ncbi:unnamed protein product [Brassica oleracea var. botrytis]
MAMKPHGKSIVSSDNDEKVIFFKDISLGPHEAQLRFRLIHFWEAWNPLKKTLIGMEMLLIDEQVIVISRFFIISKEAPVPEALISTIGQKHKFCVKVTEHNFSGKTRALTVTKILPLDTSPATVSSEDN